MSKLDSMLKLNMLDSVPIGLVGNLMPTALTTMVKFPGPGVRAWFLLLSQSRVQQRLYCMRGYSNSVRQQTVSHRCWA